MDIEDVFVLSDSDSEDAPLLDVDSLVQMTEDVEHHEDGFASQIAPENQNDDDNQNDDRPNSVTSSYLSESEEDHDVGEAEPLQSLGLQPSDEQDWTNKSMRERHRRDHLRKEYTRLKAWLPSGEVYQTKNAILLAAVSFIAALKKNQYRYECVSEKLFQKNWRLKRRLRRLQSTAVAARG